MFRIIELLKGKHVEILKMSKCLRKKFNWGEMLKKLECSKNAENDKYSPAQSGVSGAVASVLWQSSNSEQEK